METSSAGQPLDKAKLLKWIDRETISEKYPFGSGIYVGFGVVKKQIESGRFDIKSAN